MKEKLVVFAILILFLGSGIILVRNTFSALPKTTTAIIKIPDIQALSKTIIAWIDAISESDSTTQTSIPTPVRTPSPTPTITRRVIPTTVSVLSQPLIPCYRYKIPHLDGSSSNLCYSYEDYQTLQQLGYTYSSAKTFYDFHLKGVVDYQKQYEKTGSSIYLDAKKSQQDKANEQKNIMDSTLAKMYTLEQRGFNR